MKSKSLFPSIFVLTLISVIISSCNFNPSNSEELSKSSSDISSDQTSIISEKTSEKSSPSSYSSKESITSHISGESYINPDACDHKDIEETIIKEATLFDVGIKGKRCSKCGKEFNEQEEYFYLDEIAFKNEVVLYNGSKKKLEIKGLLPSYLTVEYENNEIEQIGQKEATAKILYNNKVVATKKATIYMVENKGFENIYIDTNNVAIADKENYVAMTLSTDNCNANYKLDGVPGEIRLRGNGTMTYEKKSYRIKFGSKNNLFGLNDGAKCKSWVLLADYADQSMVRNMLAFTFGDSLYNYSNNYCSDSKHVNVYINGSYNGVYLLAEQQQVNKNRVNINEPEDSYTGTDIGYFMELDNYSNQETYAFNIGTSSSGGQGGYPYGQGGNNGESINGVTIPNKGYTIKSDIYSNTQVEYIKKYMNNAHKVFTRILKGEGLYTLDENNNLVESPYDNQYETVASVVDLDSLFKSYLLEEIMKSVDVGFSSYYMYVDFSSNSTHKKLTFGAPWDFDWSSGNCNINSYAKSNGEYNSTSFDHMNPWLYMLSKMDFFKTYISKYYDVFMHSNVFDRGINKIIDEGNDNAGEFLNNYTRWTNLGTIVYKYTPDSAKNYKVHMDAVNAFVNWLNQRKTYLDSIF